MNKQVITNVFFTKEAFDQYVHELREKKAQTYGLTLEEWDNAVLKGYTILTPSGSL